MNLKKQILILLGWLIFSPSFFYFAQSDSLYIKLKKAKDVNEKLELYYTYLRSKNINPEDFKQKSAEFDSIISTIHNENDLAYSYLKAGRLYQSADDDKKSLDLFFKSLQLFERLKDENGQMEVHHQIGFALRETNNLETAIPHLYHSLQIADKLKNIELQGDNHSIIGSIFKDEGKIDSSLHHHELSLKYRLQFGNLKHIAATYNDLGLTYKRKGDLNLSLEYLIKALKIREEVGDKRGISGASINIGNTLKRLGRNSEARTYFDKGIEIALENNFFDFYMNGISGRAENAVLMKDYKTAALDYKKYTNHKDSVYRVNIAAQLNELDVRYQTEKKDSELALQDEQLKHQSEQNSKQKIIIIVSSIALIMALIAIIFVYRSYRLNKRNAKELALKNHLIEEKNQEIMDSINYAKLIQQSLLASKDMLDKNLDSYFILYKPKDVVSGDFYWASETTNGFVIACVDCTGHGVPGAFMSLIGKENLDKAISKTNEPGEILKELNNAVKKSLNQNSSTASKDGMDAAILRIEYSGNEANLTYAGANRPLYILKKDDLITEIKATKQAVGGFTDFNQEYKEHVMKLRKGDTVVISTDGYADQFGSDKNKKLTTKRFKELLHSVGTFSSPEQKQKLEDFFYSWKGNQEQLDDLLVIGIKI